MQTITTSSMRCYRRCPREYQYRYERLLVPMVEAETLRFGRLIHTALEAWWTSGLFVAIEQIRQAEADQFDRLKAEVLLIGYHSRWVGSTLKPLTVEQEFCCPLVNPITGRESKIWQLQGKIDLIAHDEEGRVYIVEHKTSSEDILDGSEYWLKLRIDQQISNYYKGAKSLGYDVVGCIYDVIGKPRHKRLLATPMEERKYTKEKWKACPLCTKKDPGPHAVPNSDGELVYCENGRVLMEESRLYSGQRELDESPEEFAERLTEVIASDPNRWYARGEVVRLDEEVDLAMADAWQVARFIRESQLTGRWPRNPDACSRYGRMCDYWPLCTKTASEHDYRTERAHAELNGEDDARENSEG
jgi:Holliday junction resolvase-like predicted endonuclease